MAIDPHYIPAFSIEDILLDKDTGAPLSGGLVYFEQDNQRGVLKPIYQITGTSPDYSYTQLPNPMTLSSIGTFEDSLSNPVVPYFFPYDSNLDIEYYYVRVTSSEDVPQFTREAVPYISNQDAAEVLSVITNEISNPQFAIVLFDTSAGDYVYTISAPVSNQVISIAPDWDLIVSCASTGTVTVTRLTPTGSLNLPTNPGTILKIASSGLTQLLLRQRITGSPNLWGSGYLSATFIAKTFSGSAVTLKMYYSQSNGTVVNQIVVSASLDASGNYNNYPGSILLPASTSADSYPNAYVDIYFDIPLNIAIGLTSVMLAFTGETSIDNLDYDQESLARQIDHLYHFAYPIVPVGTIIDFGGFVIPQYYLFCDGAAINRIAYNVLFQAVTKLEMVTLTSTMSTFTVVSSTDYHINMAIEGTGIQATTTITNIVGTTITISLPATITGTSSIRFFAWGAGDGSTTFNVPNLAGQVTASQGGAILPPGYDAVGVSGGSITHTLVAAELPPHTHTFNELAGTSGTGLGYTVDTHEAVQTQFDTGNGPGTSNPFLLIQPTTIVKKCIRYQ